MINLCNGCRRPLRGPIPDNPIARVQCECGFINLFESNVTELDLKEELQLLTDKATLAELVSDSDDSIHCREILGRTFQLCLEGARKAVDFDPPAAVASRWPNLVEFDRTSRRYRAGDHSEDWSLTGVNRAIQILEACVFDLGSTGIKEGREVPHKRVQKFLDSFFHFATSAATLAPMVDHINRGTLTAILRGGRCEFRKTPAHSRHKEWQLNRERVEREAPRESSDEELFSAAAAKAQELWLGFSPAIGRSLFADRHRLLRKWAERSEETVYAIPARNCSPYYGALFDRLRLTGKRAHRFETPFYWDLGTINETEDSWEVLRRLGSRNWQYYYPVLDAIINGEAVFFISAEALTHTLAGLESLKSGLLQRVADTLRADPAAKADLRTRVNQLRVATNRKFEELAAQRGRELGFDVVAGLDRLEGRSMEGGEIDLLWTARLDGRIVIILGEVKDFDLALHRPGSEKKLRNKIHLAEQQIERKADTVRGRWRTFVQLISKGRIKGEGESALLAKMLLTSDYVPPHLPERYPALTLHELHRFVEDIRRWPVNFSPRFAEHSVERLS